MNAAHGALVRVRLILVLARPALVILLGMFAALGVAHAGHAEDHGALLRALLVVVGFVTFAVAVNDLSDIAVDRINLAGDLSRPLVVGTATTIEVRIVAVVGALVALVVAATIGWACAAITLAGLLLACAYSIPPLQLSRRGFVAPLLLPFGFVAVPFLAGILAARPSIKMSDLGLLGGLYLGFIGRILLKDFRDVRGDALLGKRTFLVRRGRVWTCRLSAALWVAGSAVLMAVAEVNMSIVLAYAAFLVAALLLLGALERSTSPRTDEALIAAIAICGRGLILALLVHYGTAQAATAPVLAGLLMAVVTLAMLWWAVDIARFGEQTNLLVPADRSTSQDIS